MKEAATGEQQIGGKQTVEQEAVGQQASLLALSRRSRRATEQEAVAEQETAVDQEAVDMDHSEQGNDSSGEEGAQEHRGFRHWCRQRPFISGLLVVLGGIELFFSGQLDLENLQIQFGIEGMQATIIPIVVVLLGAFAIFRPTHHVFYGIIALVLAIYSLIGVNLGGFIIGMLLSSIGAVLVVAWMGPREPKSRTEKVRAKKAEKAEKVRAKKAKKSHAKEPDTKASGTERRGDEVSAGEEGDS